MRLLYTQAQALLTAAILEADFRSNHYGGAKGSQKAGGGHAAGWNMSRFLDALQLVGLLFLAAVLFVNSQMVHDGAEVTVWERGAVFRATNAAPLSSGKARCEYQNPTASDVFRQWPEATEKYRDAQPAVWVAIQIRSFGLRSPKTHEGSLMFPKVGTMLAATFEGWLLRSRPSTYS